MNKNQTDVFHINEGKINEPVAVRYDFDGNGYLYMDAGSGSDWASRVKDCEFLYTHPIRELNEPIAWMHTNSKQIFKTEKPNQFDLPLFTPLYAHPMRELNEPIAYCVDLEEDALFEASKIIGLDSTDVNFLKIPLYTHPMSDDEDNDIFRKEQVVKFYAEARPLREKYKHRELTDDEILKIYDEVYVKNHNDGIDFARAIIKASRGEK
jgi:hypothetical protein